MHEQLWNALSVQPRGGWGKLQGELGNTSQDPGPRSLSLRGESRRLISKGRHGGGGRALFVVVQHVTPVLAVCTTRSLSHTVSVGQGPGRSMSGGFCLSLMRLPCRYWLGREGPCLRWLIPVAGKLVLSFRREPQFLPHVLNTQQLASPEWVIPKKEQGGKSLDVSSYVHLCHHFDRPLH